jgi:N-succinyldiaminopimelate aminotransferase
MTGLLPTPVPAGHVAERAANLPGSELARLLVAAGELDIVNLAVGTPQFPLTPQPAMDAVLAAMRAGRNQYEAPEGAPELRERIARALTTPAHTDEITITSGATEGLCVALQSLVDPGDEVIVLEPFYENFLGAITLAGGVARFVPCHPPDWDFDRSGLRAAFGPRTRAVLLNTPNNPTGRLLRPDELHDIAALCEQWNVTVVSDEAYAGLVFDGAQHLSAADLPALRDRAIVVGSLSKSHAVSGWRLGYLRAPAARTAVLRRVHEATTNGTAAPLQAALGETGLLDGWARAQAHELGRLRDQTVRIFARLGIRFGPIEGGCFALGRIDAATTEDSATFSARLARERGVLLAPGRPFFRDRERADQYVRIAFNRPWSVLEQTEQRLHGRP